jgi:hypothetical protein
MGLLQNHGHDHADEERCTSKCPKPYGKADPYGSATPYAGLVGSPTPKRKFDVRLKGNQIVTVEADRVRFEGQWVAFYDGAEYEVPTKIRAFSANWAMEVTEVFDDQQPA